ncbi:hypothetical protein Q5H91_05685 [Sphingomonas sp. KR1UV-12]|uniref:Polysaccharide polymerase n=1 Tax=Sphingomonas aurea TaxID=3063994 RepID=A0ABT9EJ75_9SPHN|nr:hypothetical protein [Sphingomonas sp. KR1UV-12]MDP1026693.1 hypothetical protein [Sphingomonas sp. KR1UV-12]
MFARDVIAAPLRFYLDQVHLGVVWLVPDVLALAGFALFLRVLILRLRAPLAILILAQFVVGLAIGIVFMSSGALAIFSSIKLFLPFAIGFAMAGRSMMDMAWVRRSLMALLLISVSGLLIAPHVDFPWVGAELEMLGKTLVANLQWWSDDGTPRYGGFASDSTSAAFNCIFLFFLLADHAPRRLMLALIPAISLALYYSNSKTAMGLWALYLLYRGALLARAPETRLRWTRLLARWSFVCVPLPVILVVLLSGVDLSAISPKLFSAQDRISNTWMAPFAWLRDNDPILLLTGCGYGCFGYPMLNTEKAGIIVPLDNFYLTGFVMSGVSYLFVVIAMFFGGTRSGDPIKLQLIWLFNVYTVSLQCYGPGGSSFLIAYAFSDAFLPYQASWRRRIAPARAVA